MFPSELIILSPFSETIFFLLGLTKKVTSAPLSCKKPPKKPPIPPIPTTSIFIISPIRL